MKKLMVLFVSILAVCISAVSSHAALIDRGGGLIYDDDLNITWLQDANLAGTTMNWWDARDWALNLVYAGYDDWRLPTALNQACYGYNCTGSEMGHLYYMELGNPAYGPLTNTGPFTNVPPYDHWSGTEYAPNPDSAWVFGFGDGCQNAVDKAIHFYAWAVRDGDVAPVPEPTSLFLLGTGLIGVIGLRLRGKK